MKKYSIMIILMLLMLNALNITSVQAEETNSEVVINETTFPDDYIRWYVATLVDSNNDLKLQQDEINKVELLKINFEEEGKTYSFTGKETINLKGLEIFTNMKVLEVVPKLGGKSRIYNVAVINNFYKLEELRLVGGNNKKFQLNMANFPKLRELEISDIKGAMKLELSGNPKLETLKIGRLSCLNKINLTGNPKLSYFSIYGVGGNAFINLSKLKNLSTFECGEINVRGLRFGNLKKITQLELGVPIGKKNKTIKKLDVSGLENLKTLWICDFTKLKTLKLGRNNNLEDIYISRATKLKEIDVSRCKNIRTLDVVYSGLKKLQLSRKQEFASLSICGNKIKSINLKGMDIGKLYIENNPIKQIDVSGIKGISYIKVPKKTKVITGKKQRVKIDRYKRVD